MQAQGAKTTFITCCFVLALLCEQQDIQDRVLEEQKDIQGVSRRALQLWKLIEIYTEDIHNVLIPQFDEDDQEGRIHFQQDGAPPHYLGEVREYLNTRFPGRWIGTAGGRSAALPKEVTLNHNYPR